MEENEKGSGNRWNPDGTGNTARQETSRSDVSRSSNTRYEYSYHSSSSRAGKPPKPDKNAKADAGLIPIWAIVVGACITPPFGIILLFIRLAQSGVLTSRRNNRAYMDALAGRQTADAAARNTQPTYQQDEKTVAQPETESGAVNPYAKRRFPALPTALAIIGGVFALGGVSEIWEVFNWSVIHQWGFDAWDVEQLLGGLTMSLTGLGSLWGAWYTLKSQRLREKIAAIVGDAPVAAIGEVARAASIPFKKASRCLQSCINRGVFGPGAYLDMRNGTLVTGAAPDHAERVQPKTPEQQQAEVQQEQKKAVSKYQTILDQLRAVNEAIPGEEMTAKINRLENATAKIFELAEKDPDKLPQLRKFMDYYLPTALKLLQAYSQLEAQGVEGENIRESKRRIEETMDTLADAFENQLDKLFASDALDISSDISVMENMLRADGLTDDGFNLTQNM